jgi:hypothetical protein
LSQPIGVFRIMLRSKARADAMQGYFGADGAVTGILEFRIQFSI